MIDFGPVERMLRRLRAADEAEREGCRLWIEAVKRRLGLIEHGDDAAARMAQREQDHGLVQFSLTPEHPVAYASVPAGGFRNELPRRKREP